MKVRQELGKEGEVGPYVPEEPKYFCGETYLGEYESLIKLSPKISNKESCYRIQ